MKTVALAPSAGKPVEILTTPASTSGLAAADARVVVTGHDFNLCNPYPGRGKFGWPGNIQRLDNGDLMMVHSWGYWHSSFAQPRLIEEKSRVARQKNARYATAAFVTGGLDPVRSREAFLELIDGALVPILAVCGTETPPRSWEEMAAIFGRPGVTVSRVPGALAPHEEQPAPVSRAVSDFLLSANDAARDPD